MKKITLLLLIILTNPALAQVKNGETIPDLEFKTILNAPVNHASLNKLKGKVVVIEFWATWCGSCLVAMPHLKALQKQYQNKLLVITVTDETAKRTGQYLAVKPSNLWFAVDTNRKIAGMFPHQLIPHTVLISPDGKLIANTDPESVTGAVIDSIWRNKQVDLPEKKDNIIDHEQIFKTYFFAADTVKHRFTMQSEIKGSGGMSTTYLNDSVFNGRRITMINLPLTTMYMIAYGSFPYGRTVNNTGEKSDKAQKYCLDLIVENKKDLLPELKQELARRFDIQAKIEPQNKEVYVLKISDPDKLKTIPVNTSGKRTYFSMHGQIDQQGMTMTDFAQFLEDYGVATLPVVDETHVDGKFDIKFSFQPENPASITKILTDMGLQITKDKRDINMLLLYKQGL